jgi:hypothetical protein
VEALAVSAQAAELSALLLVLTPTCWLLRMRRPASSSRAIQRRLSGSGQSSRILLMAAQLRPAWMTGPARAMKRQQAATKPLQQRVLQGWRLD